MEKFNVKIHMPASVVILRDSSTREEVELMHRSVQKGAFFRVISAFNTETLVNPSFVTHIEATPTNQPF